MALPLPLPLPVHVMPTLGPGSGCSGCSGSAGGTSSPAAAVARTPPRQQAHPQRRHQGRSLGPTCCLLCLLSDVEKNYDGDLGFSLDGVFEGEPAVEEESLLLLLLVRMCLQLSLSSLSSLSLVPALALRAQARTKAKAKPRKVRSTRAWLSRLPCMLCALHAVSIACCVISMLCALHAMLGTTY